jgi:DNA-directed RNA polymerase specialized sigma subunit
MATPTNQPSDGWEFEQFLLLLDTHREQAGEKYELLRRKLGVFFRARGHSNSDELADETIDRVVRRVADTEIADVVRFSLGVARRVSSEHHRHPANLSLDEIHEPKSPSDPNQALHEQEEERRRECLIKFINELEEQDRTIIQGWYLYTGSEKVKSKEALMRGVSASAGALRTRAFRIRQQLRERVEEYLASVENRRQDR